MIVRTVSIVMAILCTLSSWRSAQGGDTIAIAVGNSTAIAVNKGSDHTGSKAGVPQPSIPQPSIPQPSIPLPSIPQPSIPRPSPPSNAGSSSGGNDKNSESDKIETTTMSYSKWKDELEKRLGEIFVGTNINDLNKNINALMSVILETLAKTDLPEAIRVELNLALQILIKVSGNKDTSVQGAAYNQALCILFSVLGMGEESDKIETTTMSYSKWKEGLLKALDEIYGGKNRNDLDADISALMSVIQEALAKTGPSGTMTADLYFALKVLIKVSGNNDASVKNAAYNNAFCTLTTALRE